MTHKIIPLNPHAHNLAGRVFGRAIAVAPVGVTPKGNTIWACACHCGNIFTRAANDLKKPYRHACGCLGSNASHGLIKSVPYRTWRKIIQRCTNPLDPGYPNYGGRGITVCDSWRYSACAFYADMGERPAGTSIDRINNDGPYSPENCRWATPTEQANNRRMPRPSRRARFITYGGETLTIAGWAKRLGIRDNVLRGRFRMGWPVEKALQS